MNLRTGFVKEMSMSSNSRNFSKDKSTRKDSTALFDFLCVPPSSYVLVYFYPHGYTPNQIPANVTGRECSDDEIVDCTDPAGSISGSHQEDTNNEVIGDDDLEGILIMLKDDNGTIGTATSSRRQAV